MAVLTDERRIWFLIHLLEQLEHDLTLFIYTLAGINLCQCLKCRLPVITMARLFCLQYSMESLSRTEPPG
jgi:hypothetical protein